MLAMRIPCARIEAVTQGRALRQKDRASQRIEENDITHSPEWQAICTPSFLVTGIGSDGESE